MRAGLVWIFALAAALPVAQAQSGQTASPPEPLRAYTLLGEDEDWSFLKDPSLRQDLWDPLKYIPLGTDGWYLSIGGGMRQAFEQVGNDNWGKQPYTNAFFLQRYVLHTDCISENTSARMWSLRVVWSYFGKEDRGRLTRRSSTSRRRL
jgi:hypothetical protein